MTSPSATPGPADERRRHPVRRRAAGAAAAGVFAAFLAACSSSTPPVVPVSPTFPPGVEFSQVAHAMADCVGKAGFSMSASIDSDGLETLATHGIPDGRTDDELDKALKSCGKSTGWSAPPPPLTVEQATDFYDRASLVTTCLAEHDLPTTEAPARQTFVDAALKNSFIWDPYASANNAPGRTGPAPQEVCPMPEPSTP